MKIDQPHLSIPIETDKAGLLYLSKEIDAARLMADQLEASKEEVLEYIKRNDINPEMTQDKVDALSQKIECLNFQIAQLTDILENTKNSMKPVFKFMKDNLVDIND